jgi:nicotinamide mononucleotide transporter
MLDIVQNIKNGFLNTSIVEWLGVLSGLIYVILISNKKISAWFFALLSSGIYVYLCYISNLFLETGLQFFYVAMAIYGWLKWKKDSSENENEIIQWKLKHHLINIFLSGSLTVIIGYIFDNYTSQANPYTDAFSTIFSLVATYMVTKKVLENWIYWVFIDAVCIYLFASRELYMTSILFLLYTTIAAIGYFQWRKLFKIQISK